MRQRSPTIADVASLAGVSTATVSRVVNGDARVSPHMNQLVSAAISELGYRQNAVARGLATGRTGTVGVLIPDVEGPLYAQMARGIENALRLHGMRFMSMSSDREPGREESAIRLLLEQNVESLILIGSILDEETHTRIIPGAIPLVFIQREYDSELHQRSLVRIDNALGTRQALSHLVELGHESIAHISGMRKDGFERERAYRAFMQEHGLKARVARGESSAESGSEAAAELLADGSVTAIYCSNDRSAAGVYRHCRDAGIRIPEDLSVIGFDSLHWCEFVSPPLTSVIQDGKALGTAAVDEVLRAIRGDRTARERVISTELAVRGSATQPKARPGR